MSEIYRQISIDSIGNPVSDRFDDTKFTGIPTGPEGISATEDSNNSGFVESVGVDQINGMKPDTDYKVVTNFPLLI